MWENPGLDWLLAEFRLLVNESIRIALRADILSRARLARAACTDLRPRRAPPRRPRRFALGPRIPHRGPGEDYRGRAEGGPATVRASGRDRLRHERGLPRWGPSIGRFFEAPPSALRRRATGPSSPLPTP